MLERLLERTLKTVLDKYFDDDLTPYRDTKEEVVTKEKIIYEIMWILR